MKALETRAGKRQKKKQITIMLSAVAGALGLEPRTRGFGVRCSTNWSYTPMKMAPQTGLEPVTS